MNFFAYSWLSQRSAESKLLMAGEEKESGSKIAATAADSSFYYLQKFQLFETLSVRSL